jgi:tetratricopeptide (TPR) repeat protein
MTQSQNSGRTWAESLESAARYFTDTEGGAFRFAVTDDELVQRRFNTELQQVLRGKGTPVQIHDWSKASPPDMYPAEQLRRLMAAHPETKGIICIGLERAMWENPEMLTLLNFAREALAEVGVPLFFWISFKTLPLMSRFAIDLYNQRIGANLYFEYDTEIADTDGSAMRFIAHETVHANRDRRPLEARLKLLEKQFDELKKIQSPEKLANDIVLELLKVYVKIPGMTRMVQSLLDEYGGLIDVDKPGNCFEMAKTYEYLGDVQKAEQHYQQALKQYRLLAEQNPEAWLPAVALTLNNLAVLQWNQNDYNSADKGYKEAQRLYRELSESNPQIYLPEVAKTLNNHANLQWSRHEYDLAEKDYREALNIRRNLAASNSHKYLSAVATTLNNLAVLQWSRHEYDSAEKDYRETLAIYLELAESNPQMYVPDVAMTLNNLAALQLTRKDYGSAEKGFREALDIYRELAEGNPQSFLQDVALTLSNMGLLYQEGLPDKEKSLACVREAVPILLSLKERLPKTRQDFERAMYVVKEWGLDPDEFITSLNISNPAAPVSSSAPESSQNPFTEKS